MTSIQINQRLAARLLAEAERAPAVEVCGFLGGRGGVVRSIYPVANIAEQPERRFAIDPGEQIAVFKTLRERGESLLATYHSHPSAPAEPSARDSAGLGYPEALVVIISLGVEGAPEMRAWRRESDRMREVVLTIVGC